MFDVFLDEVSAISKGLLIVKRPSFPSPTKKQNEYDIPGLDGMMYEECNVYNDIQVCITFNYLCSAEKWHDMFRKSKKWIYSAKELVLNDDVKYYHKIKNVIINTNERESLHIGKFEVIFVLDPYYYLKTGKHDYSPKECLNNRYSFCKPIYIIEGEGQCVLTVNKKAMKANISKNLTIDTNLKISFNSDVMCNTSVSGYYEDLWLYEKNTIDITNGFKLTIIPNWRSL